MVTTGEYSGKEKNGLSQALLIWKLKLTLSTMNDLITRTTQSNRPKSKPRHKTEFKASKTKLQPSQNEF